MQNKLRCKSCRKTQEGPAGDLYSVVSKPNDDSEDINMVDNELYNVQD